MSWKAIAQKDVKDSLRSRTLGFMTLLLGITVVTPFLFLRIIGGSDTSPDVALQTASSVSQIIVPIMALVASYLSIAGERETGSIKTLLGLPVTRLEAIIGKVVGRAITVTTSILLVYATVAVIILLFYQTNPILTVIQLTGLTILLGISFTGIGVGISSILASKSRSMAAATGVYIILLFWNIIPVILNSIANSFDTVDLSNEQLLLVRQIEPLEAYSQLAQEIIGSAPAALLTPAQSIGVLIIWGAIPVILGYQRFRKSDLN